MEDDVIAKISERRIEQWAIIFGTEVILGKLWVEGPGVRINDKLALPPH